MGQVKSACNAGDPSSTPGFINNPWGRDRLPTPAFLGFPCGSAGKESTCNARDPGLIPGSGRSAGEGIGYPLQYSWASLVAQLVKKPPAMWDPWIGKIPWRRERLPTPVFWPGEFHGLYRPWGHKESDTTKQLSLSLVAQNIKNLPAMQEIWVQSLGLEDALEKGMATCSSLLAWEIPWTEEPGGLQSMGSQSRTRLSDFTLPFPSPGDLPNPGIEPRSPTLQADSLPAEPQGKPKNTGVGSLSLLQQIFLIQELNQGLLHCRQTLYQLSYQGSQIQVLDQIK